jgi:hypothetical protein
MPVTLPAICRGRGGRRAIGLGDARGMGGANPPSCPMGLPSLAGRQRRRRGLRGAEGVTCRSGRSDLTRILISILQSFFAAGGPRFESHSRHRVDA